MEFSEDLPSDCPPGDAHEIDRALEVFRLVRTDPPEEGDFMSQRALRPGKVFNVAECIARGLSVFEDMDACAALTKLPNLRKHKVCRVRLNAGAGYIQTTGANPKHRTWWPFATFDILANCRVETL